MALRAGGGGSAADYTLGEKLGQGAFGVVYRAKRKRDGLACVIKQVETRRLSAQQKAEARNEVRLLRALDHPHVVRYIDTFEAPGERLSIVMEHCAKGDLSQKLKSIKVRGRRMAEPAAWKIVLQTAEALRYIHGKKVLRHRPWSH